MKSGAKYLYEKMIDYKRFAVILLAVGVFFYLGMIIPSETKNRMDTNIMTITSISFIAGSILFFTQAKHCRSKLLESEEGEEYLTKK